ncbi:MAG: GNAT family N-acetyltransferase [Planctomycetota bacterium]
MSRIESLPAEHLGDALTYLLATPGARQGAAARQVQVFLDYIQSSPLEWEGFRIGTSPRWSALALVLLLPGSTVIIMVPTPGEMGIDQRAQRELTMFVLKQLGHRKLNYVQALLLPEARGQRELLRATGFQHLAPLVYLERAVRYPWVPPPQVDESEWISFNKDSYDSFAATLLATYQDSLDCPELSGLRSIEDIIAGHQSSGVFDPAMWELLRLDGTCAGCLLLSPLAKTPSVEVVYMAVVPGYRRRGLGGMLLRRALQLCRQSRARTLTLVVDDRNAPAKALYQCFAFEPTARREAWLYRWRE